MVWLTSHGRVDMTGFPDDGGKVFPEVWSGEGKHGSSYFRVRSRRGRPPKVVSLAQTYPATTYASMVDISGSPTAPELQKLTLPNHDRGMTLVILKALRSVWNPIEPLAA